MPSRFMIALLLANVAPLAVDFAALRCQAGHPTLQSVDRMPDDVVHVTLPFVVVVARSGATSPTVPLALVPLLLFIQQRTGKRLELDFVSASSC